MSKEILFGSESRNKLKAGIDKLADAVKVTYGSKGRTVIISREYGEPHITKDGVTVARSVESSDSIENTGVELMKSIASKTAEIAGDGTTTATVLAQAIISNGFKLIAAGANPVELKKGIDKGVEKVISYLKDKSETVTDEKLIQIATVSSNGDSEIGQLIGNAYAKIGKDGIIDVQDSPNYETFITVVEGLNFDRGFISPYFKNSMEKDICVFENAYILFVDRRISMFEDITPLLEKIVDSKRPLLIVSEDLTDNALNALVVNRMRSGLPVCAVKSPGFGDRRRELLEDMAIITGGKVFSENEDLKLAEIDDLGYAKKILIDRNSTTIIGGNGDSNLIDERVLNVRNKISDTVSEYDKEKLEERLAKLTGGVAVLNVGAPSEVELKEKKDRIDDAVRATKGAIQEGISVGGGTAYIRSINVLKELKTDSYDEMSGINILIKALEAPLNQLCLNAAEDSSYIVRYVKEESGNIGFNINSSVFEDLVEAGILDATKVLRVALENAASVASMILISECSIGLDNTKKETE